MNDQSYGQATRIEDNHLSSAKQRIQEESRQQVASGNLNQSDLFLVRPDVARRALVTLKA